MDIILSTEHAQDGFLIFELGNAFDTLYAGRFFFLPKLDSLKGHEQFHLLLSYNVDHIDFLLIVLETSWISILTFLYVMLSVCFKKQVM